MYNREYAIREALDCLRAQTFSDFEVIVADDGSTDATKDMVAECAANDSRIRVLSLSHRGVSAARNAAITEPGLHKFIAFLDSDDLWRPAHLWRALRAFETLPEAGVYFGRVDVDDVGRAWSQERLERHLERIAKPVEFGTEIPRSGFYFLKSDVCRTAFLLNEFFPQPSSVVVKKNVIRRTPWFRLDLAVLEDCELFLTLAAEGCHFVFDSESHVHMRRFGDNLSGIVDVLSERAAPRLRSVLDFKKSKVPLCRSQNERRFVTEDIANAAYLLGQNFAERFDLANARAAYLESLRHRLSYPAVKGLITSMLPTAVIRLLRTRHGRLSGRA